MPRRKVDVSDFEIVPDGAVIALVAGEHFRFCVEYETQIRALLWLSIRRDGSLYTGFGNASRESIKRFIGQRREDGTTSFSWGEYEFVAGPERPKMSFHSSGVILGSHGRSVGVNLRLLTQRTLLCTYLPSHPTEWRVVPTPRRHDAVASKLIMDECPVSVDLYYQPARHTRLVSNLEKGMFVLHLQYGGLDLNDDVLLHLVVARQPSAGVWRPISIITWPSIEGRQTPSKVEEWIEPLA